LHAEIAHAFPQRASFAALSPAFRTVNQGIGPANVEDPSLERKPPMRIDIEQFLAATMFLGAAGAVGVAVYSTQTGALDGVVDRVLGDDDASDPDAVALEIEDDVTVARAPVAVVPSVPRGPEEPPPIIPDPEPSADQVPPPHGEG
jgi:hypothetical protein